MNYRKLLSVALVLTMILSQFGFAMAQDIEGVSIQSVLDETQQYEGIEAEAALYGLQYDDKVRIVVEFEEEPVVSHAIKEGVLLEELDYEVQANAAEALVAEQKSTRSEIETLGMDIDYHYEFINVFNGFSATTSVRNAKVIEGLSNVKRVTISQKYYLPEPLMETSNDMVESPSVWSYGYKGENTVVAVIDSGIYPGHQDMQKITNPERARYKRPTQLPEGLPGKWYNHKVPYAYNYYDNTDHVTGDNDHGMHVSGTVGANGTLKGVAPEAQILGMKVFGDDPDYPYTYSDIYVRAIEDALVLGADAINMSLGSTASFLIEEAYDPARMAIKNASNSGVLVVVSAGNSDRFGSGHPAKANPLAANPDIGVVGSPSLNPETLSVASFENTHRKVKELIFGDDAENIVPYMKSGDIDPAVVFAGQKPAYAYCGIGALPGDLKDDPTTEVDESLQNDFEGVELEGKVALIQRGSMNFSKKILNAQTKGAIGIIVFNSAAGGDEIMGMSYGDDADKIKIPAVFTGINPGLAMKDFEGEKILEFTGGDTTIVNTDAGKFSSFTSWGVTPNLDFKPEITAPGGKIYSTMMDGSYDTMSGTSMAAPHVAGGAALVAQKITTEYGEAYTGQDRYRLMKNLLMSTAIPDVSKEKYNAQLGLGNYTSPRRQGAGMMNLVGATRSRSIVVNPLTGVSKVNLKEIGDVTNFQVEVVNFADYYNEVTFKLSGTVETDLSVQGMILNEPQAIFDKDTLEGDLGLGNYPITFRHNGEIVDEITLKDGESKVIDVTIDLSNAVDWANNLPLGELFPNGGFVEGFIRLDDVAENEPSIGLPYMGFYGEWDDAPITDTWNYDVANPESAPQHYGMVNALVYDDGGFLNFLGYRFDHVDENGKVVNVPDRETLAIDPTADNQNHARALMTFLRNAKEVEVNILDMEGNVVRRLAADSYLRKNYYDSNPDNPIFTSEMTWLWDGKINNTIKEGEYLYEVKSRIDYPDAEWQVSRIPVYVDMTAPEISAATYDEATGLLTFEATDADGIDQYLVLIDGELMRSRTGEFDLNGKLDNGAKVVYGAEDYAGHVTESTLVIGDTEAPVFVKGVMKPAPMSLHNSNYIEFVGRVTDNLDIKEVFVNGKQATFNPYKPIEEEPAIEGEFVFNSADTFEDGFHSVKVQATDFANLTTEFERKFAVDATPPTIEMTQEPSVSVVASTVDSIPLSGVFEDNYTGLTVKVNGSLLFNESIDYTEVKTPGAPIVYTMDNYHVPLDYGKNIILIEASDDAGNTTTKEYKVYRNLEGTDNAEPKVVLTVAPDENVSSDRPVQIAASSDRPVDWHVVINDALGNRVEEFTSQGIEFNASWSPELSNKLSGDFEVIVKASYEGIEVPVVDFTETKVEEENADQSVIEDAVDSATELEETTGDSEESPSLEDALNAVEEAVPQVPAIEETLAEETPAEETPAEETPAEETPAEETPAEETPAEETPAEETPAEETPAEETPAEETPAEETPAEETPVEETPAEKTPTIVEVEVRKTFTVYNYPVKITDVTISNEMGGTVIAAGIEKLSDVESQVMLIVQVKDGAGKVVNITTARVAGNEFVKTINLSSGFAELKKGTYQVDVFVWTGWNGQNALSTPLTKMHTVD